VAVVRFEILTPKFRTSAGLSSDYSTRFRWVRAFAKGLTIRRGQTHVMNYLKPLLERIERGELDPTFVITHRLPLDAPRAYRMFRDTQNECVKVVRQTPGACSDE
jgi:threonine dehydrogenase-like Zn-dependent dehydrogenase